MLLNEETEDGRNAWYEAKARLGETAGYIEDVERSWERVQMQSRRSYERGEPILTLEA